jgi:hypothetical protein
MESDPWDEFRKRLSNLEHTVFNKCSAPMGMRAESVGQQLGCDNEADKTDYLGEDALERFIKHNLGLADSLKALRDALPRELPPKVRQALHELIGRIR